MGPSDLIVIYLNFALLLSWSSVLGHPDLPDNLDTWNHKGSHQKPSPHHSDRIWTTTDLDAAFSVLNLGQMAPLFERLEGGLPVTVLAFGDSITADFGGCYHRDR